MEAILMQIFRFFYIFIFSWIMISILGCSVPKSVTPSDQVEKYRKVLSVYEDTLTISFLENGDQNAPLFVMVHGTPGSALGWADYIAKPLAHSNIIAIDRLGFGKSTSNRSYPNLEDQVMAIHHLIPSNDQRVILVGHSLGGPIVAKYAAEFPEKIQSIVILAGSLDPAQEKIHPLQYFGNWPIVRSLLPKKIRHANEELLGLKTQLELLEPELAQIKAKVVIVHGDKDDLVPFENVAYLQAHLNKAVCVETIVIKGQNHFLPWNSEQIVREAMQIASKSCK